MAGWAWNAPLICNFDVYTFQLEPVLLLASVSANRAAELLKVKASLLQLFVVIAMAVMPVTLPNEQAMRYLCRYVD